MSSDLKDPREKKTIGFRFAWKGLIEVVKTERNFRIHLMIALFVLLAGIFFRVSLVEWAILTLAVTMVMTVEMVNSSIERIMDYLAPERHPLTAIIKDVAAGSVLIASIGAVIIGGIIFIPRVIDLINYLVK